MAEAQEPREGYIAVGRVIRPFGLDGDVKVDSLTDFPERFAPGATVFVAGQLRTVERSRSHKGALYIKLHGVESVEEADALRNELVEVPETDLRELPEGDVYAHQLIGLPVVAISGEELGAITEVLHPGPNSVLVVVGPRGEVLVPFIEDVVRAVDLAGRRVTVDVIEGMLPEEKPARERKPGAFARRRARRQAAQAAADAPGPGESGSSPTQRRE